MQRLRPKLMTVCAVLASLDSDPMGEWYRLGRDEAHCRADGRRNDYVHDSRADSGSGVLCVDEGTCAAARHIAAGNGQ